MASITITEGLAELKTIDSRLEKKRQAVFDYLYRQELIKDPLAKDGGSVAFVRSERDAIRDLEERKVAIRRAIAKANDRTEVTVGGTTRTIAEWLTFRRDVAAGRKKFLADIRARLSQVRKDAQQKGLSVAAAGEAQKDSDIVVNLNEKALATETEDLESVLGTLDGQLSLKNATVTIDV